MQLPPQLTADNTPELKTMTTEKDNDEENNDEEEDDKKKNDKEENEAENNDEEDNNEEEDDEEEDDEEEDDEEEDYEELRQYQRRHMELTHDYPLHAYLPLSDSKVWRFVQYVLSNSIRYPVLHKMALDDLDTDNEVYLRTTIDDFVCASVNNEEVIVDDFPWEELEAAATRYTTLMTCAATEAKYLYEEAHSIPEYDYMLKGKRIPRL